MLKIEENNLKKIEELTNRINADLSELRKIQVTVSEYDDIPELYEFYKGKELIMVGTIEVISKKTMLKEGTIRGYSSPKYLERNKDKNVFKTKKTS